MGFALPTEPPLETITEVAGSPTFAERFQLPALLPAPGLAPGGDLEESGTVKSTQALRHQTVHLLALCKVWGKSHMVPIQLDSLREPASRLVFLLRLTDHVLSALPGLPGLPLRDEDPLGCGAIKEPSSALLSSGHVSILCRKRISWKT